MLGAQRRAIRDTLIALWQGAPRQTGGAISRAQHLARQGDEDAALVTLHQEHHCVLVVSLGKSVSDLLHLLHRLAVHLTDEIATLQASAFRRAAWLDTDDHDAGRLRHTALPGHLRGDLLELQAPLGRRCLAGTGGK